VASGSPAKRAWEAYEQAERRYRLALAQRAEYETLASLAVELRRVADELERTAYRDMFELRETARRNPEDQDADDLWREADDQAEKAELLHELWAAIAAAYEGKVENDRGYT
jgi:hypothetical protein